MPKNTVQLPHLLLALLVVIVWGTNFVAIRLALDELPPLFLCGVRFFLTSVPAVFFVKPPRAPARFVIAYGLTTFAVQFSCLFLGIYAGVSPGIAALLNQFQVFFTILFAAVLLNERITVWQVIGAMVAFTGIWIVGTHTNGDVTTLGFVIIICGAAAWGAGNLVSKRIGNVNLVSLVVWGSLVAWPPVLALAFLVEGPATIFTSVQAASWHTSASILYIAYLSTLFGFSAWSFLLQKYSLATVAPFPLLAPIAALLSCALLLGEPLHLWHFTACSLVISGLSINMFGPRCMEVFRRRRAAKIQARA